MKANHIYTGEYSFYETFEVEPDTVSQWTGAVDKNGKMIFVGDILSINDSKERNGLGLEVVYKDFQFGCVTRNIEGFKYYWHRLEDIPEKYEVIGNIWDNPELLKKRGVIMRTEYLLTEEQKAELAKIDKQITELEERKVAIYMNARCQYIIDEEDNVTINRWWYSRKQHEIINKFYWPDTHRCEVFVNGAWHEYTEWTSSLDGKCNWDDAVLLAESFTQLPIKIDGVEQKRRIW